MGSSTIFALASVPFLCGAILLARMRMRGSCGEALVGAWACGFAFCASVVIAGSVAYAETNPQAEGDWRRDVVQSCVYRASEGCRADLLAGALKLGDAP